MNDLAHRIDEQLAGRPGMDGLPDWARELADRDRDRFRSHGLPGRRVEAWKYTPLDGRGAPESASSRPSGLDLGEAAWIDLVDGGLGGELPELPRGVTLQPLAELLGDSPGKLREALEALDTSSPADVMVALNNAALGPGLVLRVGEGVDAGLLALRWRSSEAPGPIANARMIVWLGEGARLDLVEDFATGGVVNLVQQFSLGEDSRLRHARFQDVAPNGWLISRSEVLQGEGSAFEQASLDLGAGLARHDLNTRLAGTGAACTALGAYLPAGQAHVDHHLEVRHEATGCRSEQTFRGVLQGQGRAVFSGRVHVLPGADGSEAHQSNKNLLLSRDAEVDTKPELVIEADEVVASHGATVGALDDTAVFYLRSRGIAESDARRLLTGAFCREVVEAMGNEAAREAFLARLDRHLELGS